MGSTGTSSSLLSSNANIYTLESRYNHEVSVAVFINRLNSFIVAVIAFRSAIAAFVRRPCLYCPCFSPVGAPGLFPPCSLHLPLGMAGCRQGSPVRLHRAPQRGHAASQGGTGLAVMPRPVPALQITDHSLTTIAEVEVVNGDILPSSVSQFV